jgi:UDP-GlcNAc:undecaprenyl-phosphate GlcNAc-1-phosphate transferase
VTAQDYIVRYAAVFATAAGVTYALEPLVILWANRFGIADRPDWRRSHEGTVARAGGVAFFPALMACMVLTLWCWPVFWRDRYLGLAVAALIITLTGLWDDVHGMRPVVKLLCQFLSAAVLFHSGYRFGRVSVPFVNIVVDLGAADLFLTVFAIAAIINAINMIDGLDGLAAGSSFIMAGFFLAHKLGVGSLDGPSSGLLLVVVLGITSAFLRYNFHPAKVFMGDTGAMLLGLVLAAELLDSASQGAATATILLPLVVLGIPVFDMLRTMLTRAQTSRHIFAADKNHLHHRLLGLGLSHREVVVFIYLMNLYMGMMAIIYRHVDRAVYRGLYLATMALFLFMAFYLVGMGHRRNAGALRGPSSEDTVNGALRRPSSKDTVPERGPR